jgi:hypothetical protein
MNELNVQIGAEWESKVSTILLQNGIENERMPHEHTFDILASKIKIEVKFCGKWQQYNPRQITPIYRFKVNKKEKGDYADFFACCIDDDQIFIIPNHEIKKVCHIYISYPFTGRSSSKYHQYMNRFDLIKSAMEAHP